MRAFLIGLCALALSGCVTALPAPPRSAPSATVADRLPPEQAVRNFEAVVARVEPVAESECRARTTGVNCDFQIAVEGDPRAGVNAFQTNDSSGRPYIVMTIGMIAEARNEDELAFVMGHEAAHHIEGHIAQQIESARQGALVFGVLAQASGAGQTEVRRAAELGAQVGARRFSQEHELEADALGTVIAVRAGYDAVRGAAFFDRLADPGNTFLGTHPPNAARADIVRRTAAQMGAGS